MRIFRMAGTRLLAIALAFSVLPAAVPSNLPIVGHSEAQARERHFDGGRRFYRHHGDYGRSGYYGGRGYYNRDGYYGPNRYYRGRRGKGGAIVAGTLLGLGVGAALASEPRYYRSGPRYSASRGYAFRSRDWYEYCSSRYRSFDPRSGTFQPYHGPRQLCR